MPQQFHAYYLSYRTSAVRTAASNPSGLGAANSISSTGWPVPRRTIAECAGRYGPSWALIVASAAASLAAPVAAAEQATLTFRKSSGAPGEESPNAITRSVNCDDSAASVA